MFKKGDKVTFHDCSYSFGISGGEYSFGLRREWKNVLQVVETDLAVADIKYRSKPYLELNRDYDYCIVCDTLVTNSKGGFWFTQARFLRKVEPKIEITVKVNGETRKLKDISEETLLNIRNKT